MTDEHESEKSRDAFIDAQLEFIKRLRGEARVSRLLHIHADHQHRRITEERDALQRAMDEGDKKPDPDAWQKRAEALWQILDDIDTSVDVIKPSTLSGYTTFYNATVKRVEKRFKILTSDGHHLFIPDPAIFTDSTPAPADGEYRDLIETLEAGHEGEAIDAIRTLIAQVADYGKINAGYAAKLSPNDACTLELAVSRAVATIADLREQVEESEKWRDHSKAINDRTCELVMDMVSETPTSPDRLVKLKLESLNKQLSTAERERDEAVRSNKKLIADGVKRVDELLKVKADTARLDWLNANPKGAIFNTDDKLWKSIGTQHSGLHDHLRNAVDEGMKSTAATNEQQADAGAGGEGEQEELSEFGLAVMGVVERIGDPLMNHIKQELPQHDPGQVRTVVMNLKNGGYLRMKEDSVDHDWSFIRTRKGREYMEAFAVKHTSTPDAREKVERDDDLTAAYLKGVADEQDKQSGSVAERIEAVIDFRSLQDEVTRWAFDNFGGTSSYRPLLCALEELGELAHAHLKQEQGIRTNEDHAANKVDAVADVVIALAHYCGLNGIDYQNAVEITWAKVSKRDWKNNPKNGVAALESAEAIQAKEAGGDDGTTTPHEHCTLCGRPMRRVSASQMGALCPNKDCSNYGITVDGGDDAG